MPSSMACLGADRSPRARTSTAPRIVAACADLGATYVKFGQLVASAPSVVGEEVSVAFRSLLDQGRPVGFHKVQHEVERATHEPLRTTFAEFDPEPVGRASMAVVHRAQLADGTDVAVKILRPGIERKVAADFQLMGWLIPRVASRVAGAQAQMIEPMLAGLRNQLCEELDLRNEARTMDHFNGLLTEVDLPSVAIPHTYPELSSRRVLVMEWFDGAAIDDLSAIEAFGVDPVPLVTDTVKAFFLTTARYGLFHGDVHAGNLLLLRDGRIGVLDWGIVGRLDEENREAFCDIIRAALGDEEAWGRVTDRIVAQIGPLIEHRLGVTPDQIPAMVRPPPPRRSPCPTRSTSTRSTRPRCRWPPWCPRTATPTTAGTSTPTVAAASRSWSRAWGCTPTWA